MNLSEALTLLETALREPSRLSEVISKLQHAAWHGGLGQGPAEDILRDLAYDLDFYEPLRANIRETLPSLRLV